MSETETVPVRAGRKRGKGLVVAAVVVVALAAGAFYYYKGRSAGAGNDEGGAPGAAATDARAIHDAVLVLDSHVDVLLPETPKRYYAPDGGSRASLEQLVEGGVDAVVLSIAVGPGPETPEGDAAARKEADDKLAAIQGFIAGSDGKVELARSADDVERIHKDGKVAVLLGFQNARILGTDLAAFDRYHEAGVRVAALNHAGHNAFSDSSRPSDPAQVERHQGLSGLGKQAVRRFNDLGVLIDVSQLSTAALSLTLALTRAPVVATHSDARALVDNTRNLSDAELDAIKANGGVVQLTPFSAYLRNPSDEELAAARKVRVEHGLSAEFKSPTDGYGDLPEDRRDAFLDALRAQVKRATLSDFVDHIDYVAKRIGVEHVGIGSDFDHGAGVDGFDGEKDAPSVTAELVKRGYAREQIAAIWGGNFLRVLRAAEAARER
ncbi:dipeptidase [Pseudoxanthomonas putridarboris]|uniref:Dipeptidase n=1 Tax=Pseudoxanthomonas putridarboris TaxID=752605 RepID=A0ABU9IVG1_9GAMM